MKTVIWATATGVFLQVVTLLAATNDLPTAITVDGETYQEVRWGNATPGTVTIYHKAGIARIPLEKLPAELQQHFGYEPQKAKEHRAQELAAQEQTRKADAEAGKQAAARRAKELEAQEKSAGGAEKGGRDDSERRAGETRLYGRKETAGAIRLPSERNSSSKHLLYFELNKRYTQIDPKTLIIVKFAQVASLEGYSQDAFWVNLTDGNYNYVSAIVPQEGLRYFAPGKDKLRKTGA